MTTLDEFKAIEAKELLEAISEGEKWGTLTRDEVKTVLKAARRYPALIAVAEGMAEALKWYAKPDPDVKHTFWICDESGGRLTKLEVLGERAQKELAAFEAWKMQIEGDGDEQ